MTANRPADLGPPRIAGFVLVQVVLLTAVLGGVGYRMIQWRAERQLPALRSEPIEVAPLYDYPVVISDEQLREVLTKLRTPFRGAETNINSVDHALRFWGVEAKFDDPAFMSGEQMRELLVDHRRFAEVYGEEEPSLLIDDPSGGVKVRFMEGARSSSHYDHTIAGLAEVGTPLDFPVITPTRQTDYRAMLKQSLRDFSLNQLEYEWSALAYTLLVPPASVAPGEDLVHWYSTEGQRIDFDLLADRIMRQDMPQGVCAANHRLHALVMMLRVDEEQVQILTPEARQRIIDYLKQVTQIFVQNQNPAGYWTMAWPEGPDAEPENSSLDPLAGKILATCHPLEWWALAPTEVHPPRHVLASAGQWLTAAVLDLTDQQLIDYYPFLTHAGRALSLWRGKFPSDVELSEPQ